MKQEQLAELLTGREAPTVEFKTDTGPLSDAELVEAVVCLANAQGGTLLIGVEDDGRVTGLHARRTARSLGIWPHSFRAEPCLPSVFRQSSYQCPRASSPY